MKKTILFTVLVVIARSMGSQAQGIGPSKDWTLGQFRSRYLNQRQSKFLLLAVAVIATFTRMGFAQREIPMSTGKGNVTVLFSGLSDSGIGTSKLPHDVELQASLRNDTQVTFSDVEFEMIGYDANGNDIKLCGTIIGCWFTLFDSIGPGQTVTVKTPGNFAILWTTQNLARTEFKIQEAPYFIKYDIQSEPVINAKFTISPVFSTKGIGLDFVNKSADVIEVAWDQSVYINEDGNTSRLIRGNVNLAEKDRSQPNTVIPPGAKLQETVFPVDRIKQNSKGQWVQDPILPDKAYLFGEDRLKWLKEQNVPMDNFYLPGTKSLAGKDVRIFLRLLLPNDQKQNVTIIFKIAKMAQ